MIKDIQHISSVYSFYIKENEFNNSRLPVVFLGQIPYLKSLELQMEYVERIYKNNDPGIIIVCSHDPVVTKGIKTQSTDVYGWQGEVVSVRRGGRATYHGPSQTIVYPIINLQYPYSSHPRKDVIWLIRTLENSVISALKDYGIQAHGKQSHDDTGVWVNQKKIASIGIGVTKWISYHGLALNLYHDPLAFEGIYPCGYQREIMTHLEEILGFPVSREEFNTTLLKYLLTNLI